MSAVLSAVLANEQKLVDQKVVFLGAGTAASGIADQICDAMVLEGLSVQEAHSRIWMVDINGLLLDDFENLQPFQMVYAKSKDVVASWKVNNSSSINLLEAVRNIKPTVLIGCSTASKAFTEEIVKEMLKGTDNPIIFPLSNPTSKAEAVPEDLLKWTNNKALIATGSPFSPVDLGNGEKRYISQCNNAYAFPGLGLGIIASKAKRVTKGMLWEACKALTDCSNVKYDKKAPLLPSLLDVKKVSLKVAKAVVKQAIKEGHADPISSIDDAITSVMWQPKYYPYMKN